MLGKHHLKDYYLNIFELHCLLLTHLKILRIFSILTVKHIKMLKKVEYMKNPTKINYLYSYNTATELIAILAGLNKKYGLKKLDNNVEDI